MAQINAKHPIQGKVNNLTKLDLEDNIFKIMESYTVMEVVSM